MNSGPRSIIAPRSMCAFLRFGRPAPACTHVYSLPSLVSAAPAAYLFSGGAPGHGNGMQTDAVPGIARGKPVTDDELLQAILGPG